MQRVASHMALLDVSVVTIYELITEEDRTEILETGRNVNVLQIGLKNPSAITPKLHLQ
jgi:hypothetical protein